MQSRRQFLWTTTVPALSGALPDTVFAASKKNPPDPGPAPVSTGWSPVYAWPAVAIHLHLLPTGEVMTFSDDNHTNTRDAGFTKAQIVDIPVDGPPSMNFVDVPNTTTNMFCSGHSFLPDGRLAIFGGHDGKDGIGSRDVNILERTNTASRYKWSRQVGAPMASGRWYPGAVTLNDGSTLVIGGSKDEFYDMNTLPEVWQWPLGGWKAMTGIEFSVPMYTRMHLAPDGRVFVTGPDRYTYFLDATGTGTRQDFGDRVFGNRDDGCSVMYQPGKILLIGGGYPATATTETIDLTSPAPTWKLAAPMNYRRREHNATLLADGTVLVTGGTSSPEFNDARQAVLPAELWNPATGAWTRMPAMQVPRCYHSTAILLRDGRVLSGGGGRPAAVGGVDNLNVGDFLASLSLRHEAGDHECFARQSALWRHGLGDYPGRCIDRQGDPRAAIVGFA